MVSLRWPVKRFPSTRDQVITALGRALGSRSTENQPAVGGRAQAPQPVGDALAATPDPGREIEQSTGVEASYGARIVAYGLLAVGIVIAILVNGKGSSFVPKQGFVLFTGFYVAAQAVERFLELVLPGGQGTPQAKSDRAMIVGGIAFLLGVGLSLTLGLRFLSAVQVAAPPRWLDVFVTGLVIAGGTKPLHDLIGSIERAKAGG
jgi:hypothetical protein